MKSAVLKYPYSSEHVKFCCLLTGLLKYLYMALLFQTILGGNICQKEKLSKSVLVILEPKKIRQPLS